MKHWSEEDLKAKVILPFLSGLGFETDELTLELGFSIQLGHGAYKIGTGKARTAAGGRLDVLVCRDGVNLFVIEAKAPGVSVTADDDRQVLGYARLLEPMAQVAVITNGTTVRMLETVSGKLISDVSNRFEHVARDVEAELAARCEALEHFVGYSRPNLLAVCAGQGGWSMCRLRADPNRPAVEQLWAKYVPSACVPRTELEQSFQQFARSDSVLFPVIGRAGVGKTNLMCSLYEQVAVDSGALFFVGALLSRSLEQAMASVFNSAFSGWQQVEVLLRRIASLNSATGDWLYVFLDGLDEWEAEDGTAQLDELIRLAPERRIKVVVSCKEADWPSFLSRRTVPTALADQLFEPVPRLDVFDPEQAADAANGLAAWLGMPGPDPEDMVPLDPFTLRVACETAFLDGSAIGTAVESRHAVRRFVDLRLRMTRDASSARRLIQRLARHIEGTGGSSMALEDLATSAQDANSLAELVSQGILYRSQSEYGRVSFGFHHSTIRDGQVVAVADLAPLDADPHPVLMGLMAHRLGRSALAWLLRCGSAQERRAVLSAALRHDGETAQCHVSALVTESGVAFDDDLGDLAAGVRDALVKAFGISEMDHVHAREILGALDAVASGPDRETALLAVFERLLHDGRHPGQMAASHVAERLVGAEGTAVTGTLVQWAADPSLDGYVRRYVVECLSQRTDFDRSALFVRLLRDPDANVRQYARALAPIQDAEMRDSVFAVLDDQSAPTGMRIDAAQTLWCQGPGTARLLADRARDDTLPVILRAWVLRAAVSAEPGICLDLVEEAIRGSDLVIREHAMIALGEIEGERASRVLLESMGGGPAGNWAERMLYERDLDPGSLQSLRDRARGHDDPAVRVSAVRVLLRREEAVDAPMLRPVLAVQDDVVSILQSIRSPLPEGAEEEVEALLEKGWDVGSALLALIQASRRPLRVAGLVRKHLALGARLEFRCIWVTNADNVEVVGRELRPWVLDELRRCNPDSKLAHSLLVLIYYIGTTNFIDPIQLLVERGHPPHPARNIVQALRSDPQPPRTGMPH